MSELVYGEDFCPDSVSIMERYNRNVINEGG